MCAVRTARHIRTLADCKETSFTFIRSYGGLDSNTASIHQTYIAATIGMETSFSNNCPDLFVIDTSSLKLMYITHFFMSAIMTFA